MMEEFRPKIQTAAIPPKPRYISDDTVSRQRKQQFWIISVEGWGAYFLPYVVDVTYTGCPRRNAPDFGRVFLMLRYTDITQNTYIQS